MTITKTKAELLAYAEDLCAKFNEQSTDGVLNPVIEIPVLDPEGNPTESVQTVLIKDEIEEAVNQYTALAKDECIEALKTAEDPMLEAVKLLQFPTIRRKIGKKKINKQDIPVASIGNAKMYVPIKQLHKVVEGGIGQDPNWLYKAEYFGYLMTCMKATEYGIDPKTIINDYKMRDAAKKMSGDMGKTMSKTQIRKTLQSIVKAMIGEGYEVESVDVSYLMDAYTKKGKEAMKIACAKGNLILQILMDICNRLVTENTYGLDYPQEKQKD